MTLKVFTSRISYRGPDRLDITVKSGAKEFAPTWDMVMGHKRGQITDSEYTDQYYAMMRKSYIQNKKVWDELLQRERVVLVCFCRAGTFCHRYLLQDILVKLGAESEDKSRGNEIPS